MGDCAPATPDERLKAALCHGSVALSLVLGPFTAAVPAWLWRDEHLKGEKGSRFVAFHAAQALCYQAALFAAVAVLSCITMLLVMVVVGLVLVPVIVVAVAAAIVYGVVLAVQVHRGQDPRYFVVGAMVEERWFPRVP